jgi:hypothetical protein
MDPYLEDPRLWPDVHHGLISELQAVLNARLRPKYHVRVEERVYISDEDDPARSVLFPDLRIGERQEGDLPIASADGATLTIADPVIVPEVIDDEIHEARLEIVGTIEGNVVSVIEVVSPSNKVAGSNGRDSFQRKRREVFQSRANWLEIDLLRRGKRMFFRSVAIETDYLAYSSRADQRPQGKVWPIRIRQQLPIIGIPLKPEDGDFALDLQPVFNSVYERSAFDLVVNYRSDPEIPLNEADAQWADTLLREKGLRP